MFLSAMILFGSVSPVGPSTPIQTATSSGISLSDLVNTTNTQSTFTLSTDHWFIFFGIILIIVGLLLNGKNITTKNERYGEKVKKIRV